MCATFEMAGYRIKDWGTLFETHRTRELRRMEWVPIPNKMDGLGYTSLVDHPEGAAHLGAWLAIIEVASKQSPRGTLPMVNGSTAAALARLSRLPEALFEQVLQRLASEEIAWIEETPRDPAQCRDIAPDLRDETAPRAHARNGMEWNGTERKDTTAPRAPTPSSTSHSTPATEERCGEPDDGWEQTVEAAARAGMTIDPSRTATFYGEEWAPAPLERKLACIRGIYERIDCGQFGPNVLPRFIPRFRNFWRQQGWNEPLRPNERGSPSIRKAPAQNLRDELERLERQEAS